MIFYLAFFQARKEHKIPAFSFWEYYIKSGIEEAGHQWIESDVDWAEALVYTFEKEKLEKWKSNTWEIVIKDIRNRRDKPDIFLSYFYPQHIELEAIIRIKEMGIPCVNFFCDNVREFNKLPIQFKVFDLNWVPEYKALQMYKKANLPYLHLPMPMWVAPVNRKITLIETENISFIGSKDLQRHLLFEQVIKNSLPIKIYGAGWNEKKSTSEKITNRSFFKKIYNQIAFIDRFGISGFYRKLQQNKMIFSSSEELQKSIQFRPEFEEYVRITKESKVTLGVNRYPSFKYPLNKPNTYSRLRDIEAPMLGACYLTEWTEGIENLYDVGKEIEVFKNTEEMIERANFLLKNPDKRIELRVNGQRRALLEHSINNSLSKILTYFGHGRG